MALLGPRPRLETRGRLKVARLDPESFSPPTADETVSHLGFCLPDGTSAKAIAEIHHRLRELAKQRRERDDQVITLSWGLAQLPDRLGARFVAGVVLHTGNTSAPFGPRLAAAPIDAL